MQRSIDKKDGFKILSNLGYRVLGYKGFNFKDLLQNIHWAFLEGIDIFYIL